MAGMYGGDRRRDSRERGRGGWRDRDERGPPPRDARGPPPRRSGPGGGGDFHLEQNDEGTVKVWIGGLPHDIGERELEKLCAKFGPLAQVSIKHSQRDTYAFVSYNHFRDAKAAISELDQSSPFNAGRIKVAPASKRAAPFGRPEEDARAHGDHRGGHDGYRDGYRDGPRPHDGYGRGDRGRDDRGRDDRGRDDRGRDDRMPRPQDGYGRGGEQRPSQRRVAASRSRSRPRPPWKRSRTPPRQAHDLWRVWLSCLPTDMEAEEFKDIVGAYGEISGFGYDRRPGSGSNSGWVEYRTRREADAAVLELDERRIEGWGMRLKARLSSGRDGRR